VNEIVYLDKFMRKKLNKSFVAGLLPPTESRHTNGRVQVEIICGYMRNICGRYGWTDFKEIEPEYVSMYFPRIGFMDVHKSCYKEGL